MFTTFSFVSSAPVGGIIAMPAVGAFLGWFLVAALIGLGLRLLSMADARGVFGPTPSTRAPVSRLTTASSTSHDHAHRKAA